MATLALSFFDHLCELEPRLRTLADEAAAVRDDGESDYFCANEVWFERFKPRLIGLVGFYAGYPPFSRSQAEDQELTPLPWVEALRRIGEASAALQTVDPRLTTPVAYDAAYQEIYERLPACRACCCFGA